MYEVGTEAAQGDRRPEGVFEVRREVMINYGDRVKFIRTGKVGEVIGFMRGADKFLIRFDDDGKSEMWIPGNRLEKVEDGDGSD